MGPDFLGREFLTDTNIAQMKTFAWNNETCQFLPWNRRLRPSIRWIWLALLTLSIGCSFHEVPIALQRVGPAPLREFIGSEAANRGYLVVYSKPDPLADDIYGHSRYTLVSEDAKPIQQVKVKNHEDRYGSGPTHLALPPGNYLVGGEGGHSHSIIVPVVIKEEQTTFVYLSDSPSLDAVWARQTNVVKLTDGHIVGWAAIPKSK